MTSKQIALSGWRSSTQQTSDSKHSEAVPFNSLREVSLGAEADLPRIRVNEPKRLTLSQKQATAIQVPPQPKRIVVMQSLSEQGNQEQVNR
jgi:hypothetical protein